MNTMQQARDDKFHPAQAVFLVDSDCLPSENLLRELQSQEVQDRINNTKDGYARTRGCCADEASASSRPAAIVVPCLEFAQGTAAAAASRRQQVCMYIMEGHVCSIYSATGNDGWRT